MDKIKTFKTYPYLIVLFSLYIYSFSLSRFAWIGYIIFYIVPLGYLFLNYRTVLKLFRVLDARRFLCVCLILLSLAFSVIFPLIHNTGDFSYVNIVFYIIRKMIPYVFLVVCLIKKYGEDACLEIFMYYFTIATVCYVLVTCLFLLIPSLSSFWMGFVASDVQTGILESSYGYAARVGWAGFSGFRITMKCTISVAFVMYLRFSNNTRYRISLLTFWITFAFAILGNAFYGRTGLLASVLIVVFGIVVYKRINLRSLLRWIIGIVVILLAFYVLSLVNQRMGEWYSWVMTPFINFLQTGSFGSGTADALFGRMLFKPEFSTFVWGDGIFTATSGKYYMSTDLGFMRQILFWGLPVTIVSYFLTYESIRTIGKRFWILICSLLIAVVLFEFKGLAYYEFVALFFACGLLEKGSKTTSSEKIEIASEKSQTRVI